MKLKNLEIHLQKVQGFKNPVAGLEQYMTPAPLAARFLFDAFLHGDIEGMKVLDLGCGTGMLSVGAALLGGDVTGVDGDASALLTAEENAASQKLDITYNLYRDQLFFDYATRYRRQHNTIAEAEVFSLTEEDIEDFCRFLDEKQFTYQTETGRRLSDLIKIATQEDLDSTLLTDLQAFVPRLTMDYRAAIQRNRTEVERLLGSEIVKRYYYHRGYYAYMLRYDENIQRALEAF
jgi:2-polyprenyl-3-methyl-5-hydroxy-6-metoxy-1,4-benzoquinol methylase